ncbi:MAG: ATP-dependent zinc metalloprotease FtsH [Oscillospiraceae bacterium]|nr:ATP-dependent zinc metalloprotease FtsH [Oscillospiraceae bacterium]
MNNKITGRDIGFLALVVAILVITLSVFHWNNARNSPSSADIRSLIESQQVETLTVKDSTLTMTLKQPWNGERTVTAKLWSAEAFHNEYQEILAEQKRTGALTDYNFEPSELPALLNFLPWLVLLAFFGLMLFVLITRQTNQAGGGIGVDRATHFNRARTKTVNAEGKKITFADVAGADEEKAELQEVVDFLRDPERYLKLGARIPKGILLVGPPGTGKTLLAKAVAGEAGVGFLSISGSDFVELYVGVGAGRVRDLFDQAKKDSPAIVFIDEIDAVARQRGAGLGGGHDEREQTLNQLLVEMDGFTANEGVVVLAATNRVDILDPAILRPGRFDRQVYVGEPDVKGREEILKVHSRNKPLGDDVDLSILAKTTAGFTGADLENLMNEAALRAAKFRRAYITMEDLQESVIKVLAGPEKKSRVVIERERKLTAYHEAGHALVIHALPTQDPVHSITIVPRGMAGGMTIHLPKEDRSFLSKKELTDRIAVCLGGRCAEELVLGDISTGAGSDLKTASTIARNMVMRYGMSDKLGNVVFDSGHDEVFIGRSMAQAKTYSEETANLIDEEVKSLLDEAYRTCHTILTRDREYLEQVARYLLEHETMDSETFEKIMAGA